MTLTEKIGNEIKSIRKERNISQTQYADMLGMIRTYVSKIENGKHAASLAQMERLLLPLGCTLQVVEIRKPKEYWIALAAGQTQPEDLIDEHFLSLWNETNEKQNVVRERLLNRFAVGHYFV